MKKGIKFKIGICIICGLVILLPFLSTFSRYVKEAITEHYYNSREFYFTSKSLNGQTYNASNWDGTTDYSFIVDVGNFKDELNWTKENINYEYEILCKKDEIILNCTSDSSGILSSNSNQISTNVDTITIHKGANNFVTGDTVIVNLKAKSTSPYSKELQANFNIHINSLGISYQIIDSENSFYLTLMISNNSNPKDVDISFDPSIISVDNTNNNVINGTVYRNDDNFINQLSINTETDHVYAIRFYKKDITANYSLSNSLFTIS